VRPGQANPIVASRQHETAQGSPGAPHALCCNTQHSWPRSVITLPSCIHQPFPSPWAMDRYIPCHENIRLLGGIMRSTACGRAACRLPPALTTSGSRTTPMTSSAAGWLLGRASCLPSSINAWPSRILSHSLKLVFGGRSRWYIECGGRQSRNRPYVQADRQASVEPPLPRTLRG